MIQLSLKACRVNAGFTMQKAADAIGVHNQTLAKYEKDSSDIPVSLLAKLSDLYQVPEDYIFLGLEYELIHTITIKRTEIA